MSQVIKLIKMSGREKISLRFPRVQWWDFTVQTAPANITGNAQIQNFLAGATIIEVSISYPTLQYYALDFLKKNMW